MKKATKIALGCFYGLLIAGALGGIAYMFYWYAQESPLVLVGLGICFGGVLGLYIIVRNILALHKWAFGQPKQSKKKKA